MGRMLTKAPAKTKGPVGPLFNLCGLAYAMASVRSSRALRRW